MDDGSTTLMLRTITLVPAPYAMSSPSGERPTLVDCPLWVNGFGKKVCSRGWTSSEHPSYEYQR